MSASTLIFFDMKDSGLKMAERMILSHSGARLVLRMAAQGLAHARL
jgi:hypothetical protein